MALLIDIVRLTSYVDMGFRLPDLRRMLDNLEMNIFILSYRGYGESEGEPDEAGLMVDAEVRAREVGRVGTYEVEWLIAEGETSRRSEIMRVGGREVLQKRERLRFLHEDGRLDDWNRGAMGWLAITLRALFVLRGGQGVLPYLKSI